MVAEEHDLLEKVVTNDEKQQPKVLGEFVPQPNVVRVLVLGNSWGSETQLEAKPQWTEGDMKYLSDLDAKIAE